MLYKLTIVVMDMDVHIARRIDVNVCLHSKDVQSEVLVLLKEEVINDGDFHASTSGIKAAA